MNNLLEAIRLALEAKWNSRLPGILARAKGLQDADPRDIYIQAWRDAYASALEDMVDAGLVRNPDGTIAGNMERASHGGVVH